MKRQAAIFCTGAAGYSALEVLVRGHTHWTMTLLGGACLVGLCLLGRAWAARPLWAQAAAGAAGITAAELAVGLVVNLALGWNVWSYEAEFGNLLGQICPLYSFYWFCLCWAVLGIRRAVCRLLARRARQPVSGSLPAE